MTINRFYLFLTLLVIAISGNPAIFALGKETIYIGTLMIFMALWWFKPLKLMYQDMLILVFFVLLMLTHVLNFGSMIIMASLGFFIMLCIALLAVRLIPEFPRKYITVTYVLACLSLIFYIPVQLGIDLVGILSPFRVPLENMEVIHIGIHNFHLFEERGRNSGMFWEPGAFAGYLILALLFMVRGLQYKAVVSVQGFVLIAALLSTQSTTGYLAFMVFALYYVYSLVESKGKVAKLFVFPVILVMLVAGIYITMNEVSFLGEKINKQFESASVGDEASRINRFGNLLYDEEWIASRPVFGWSASPVTRVSIDAEITELVAGQGNGLTGFAVKFGLFGLFIFIGFFVYTYRRITGSLTASLFGVVILCMLLNGEQFLNFPMFLTLIFLPQNKLRPFMVSRMADVHKLKFTGRGSGGRV